MKVLKSRLYELRKREQEEKLGKLVSEKKDIAWGSQIRSYVFQPYQLVKDHRTAVETGNVNAVMDGDIDQFIEAYLIASSGKSAVTAEQTASAGNFSPILSLLGIYMPIIWGERASTYFFTP